MEHVLNYEWRTTETFTLAEDTKLVTIEAVNPGGVGGILASFSNGVVTDGTWQCANMRPCTAVQCESSVTWQNATTYGVNSDSTKPWKRRADIKLTAQWIWVDIEYAKRVWCKKTFGKLNRIV